MRSTKTCTLILIICLPVFCYGQMNPTWIKIKPDMIFLESATKSDPMALFNEQSEGKTAKSPSKGLKKADISPLFWPYACIVDFNQEMELYEIRYFDGFSKGKAKVSLKDKGRSFYNENLQLNGDKSWKVIKINQNVRCVRIEISDGLGPTEIMFFGKYAAPKLPSANGNLIQHSRLKLADFLGVNGFIDDPLPLLSTFRWVREYHDWKWNTSNKDFGVIVPEQGEKLLYAFQPSYPGWNFDTYYNELNKRNTNVLVCFQNSSNFISIKPSYKPVYQRADPASPSSYLKHAEAMYQMAARYGKNKVLPSNLALKPNQPVKSGLGSIYAIENWNEPDRWWENRDAYFRPMEFAAMCSADYDGHQSLLGKKAGVKNADPTLPMVMGGITSLDTNYLKTIWLWAQWHRNGQIPFDILNFHYYPAHQSHALSPEEDGLKARFAAMKVFCQTYFPNLPVWCTEMGYDTDQNSFRSPNLAPNENAEMAQANQLVKSIFEAWASGIDTYFLYMLRNVEDVGSIPYQTSGLVGSKNNGFKPKLAYVWIQSVLKEWGSFTMKDDWSTSKTRVYHLVNQKRNVLVLYNAKRQNASERNRIKLKFSKIPKKIFLYEMGKSGFIPSEKGINLTDKNLQVNVSEVPQFVEYQF